MYLKDLADKRLIPGWPALFPLGVDLEDMFDIQIPVLPSDEWQQLVASARTNADAYDAAGCLAAKHLAARLDLPAPLHDFSIEVLQQKWKRPPRKGRPLASDALLKAFQYQLIVYTNEIYGLQVTRNDAANTFSACDAVAGAFSRAGRHTTHAKMKSLYFDDAYAEIRALARWAVDRQFLDPKRSRASGGT